MSVVKFFISYILVINVSLILTSPLQEASNNPVCSTDDLLKIQQSCGPAQKKLEVLIEKYDGQVPPEEIIEEMDGMFQNLTTCYATFNCTQSIEYRQYLTKKFTEIRIHNFDINGCMLEFYGALYEGTYICTKDYEWFSTDLSAKRNAYISGKSCFLEIASNECSNATNLYLKTDYEPLVDIMTTKPNGPECQGLFYELNDLKCNQPVNMLGVQFMKFLTKITPKKENEQLAEKNDQIYQFFQEDTTNKPMLCMALKDCLQNGCALKWLQKSQELIGGACDQLGKADNLNEHFFDCLWKMEMYNITKHPCIPPDLKNMTRQPDTVPLESLGKECAKSVMQEECPGIAMNDFDGNWDWAKKIEKQAIEDNKKKREMNED